MKKLKRIGANQSLHRTVRKVKRKERVHSAFRKTAGPAAMVTLSLILAAAAVWASVKVWQKAGRVESLQFRSAKLEGLDVLDSASVMAVSGLKLPCAFTRARPREIERRIEGLPWVAAAIVNRNWLSRSLRIRIRERKPVVWINADSICLADSSGMVLPPVLGHQFDFPVVSGIPVEAVRTGNVAFSASWTRARSILETLGNQDREIGPLVSEIVLDKERLTIHTLSGIRICLPVSATADRLGRAAFLIRALMMAGKTTAEVDLRFDRVAYVR